MDPIFLKQLVFLMNFNTYRSRIWTHLDMYKLKTHNYNDFWTSSNLIRDAMYLSMQSYMKITRVHHLKRMWRLTCLTTYALHFIAQQFQEICCKLYMQQTGFAMGV
jgi:hypothetical protein